jgi:hypothetical protein
MRKYGVILLFICGIIGFFRTTVHAAPESLGQRLAGRLLLQVEDRGRIWYVSKNDFKKYEVTREQALDLFRSQSLGISNADLLKIKIAAQGISDTIDSDGDGYNDRSEVLGGYNPYGVGKLVLDSALGKRLIGQLLLQVEDKGRIWYIDQNGERWEVTRENLLTLFRALSLGITNADLGKISTGIFGSNSLSQQEVKTLNTPLTRLIFEYDDLTSTQGNQLYAQLSPEMKMVLPRVAPGFSLLLQGGLCEANPTITFNSIYGSVNCDQVLPIATQIFTALSESSELRGELQQEIIILLVNELCEQRLYAGDVNEVSCNEFVKTMGTIGASTFQLQSIPTTLPDYQSSQSIDPATYQALSSMSASLHNSTLGVINEGIGGGMNCSLGTAGCLPF